MKYIVYWVSGERDGEILKEFDDSWEAIKYAKEFWDAHESEFDPCFGGVAITDENGNDFDW